MRSMPAAGMALALIIVFAACNNPSSVSGGGPKVVSNSAPPAKPEPPAKSEPPPKPEAEPQTPPPLEHAQATESDKPTTLPLATECKPAKDPSIERLDALNGCKVSFTSVHIVAARTCTKIKCSSEDPCCNRCEPGGMNMFTQGVSLVVNRDQRRVRCQAGNSCPALGECEIEPGHYDVAGVVSRHSDGYWQIALERANLRPTPTSVVGCGINPGHSENATPRCLEELKKPAH